MGAGGAFTELPADHEFGAALVDAAQTLICVLDRDGRIVRFDRACERATGFSADEVVGRRAAKTVIPPEEQDAFAMWLVRVGATRAPSPEQGHWATRDGGRRVIASANRPLLDEDGHIRYIVTSRLDVTESETAAAELWALQGELRDRLAELAARGRAGRAAPRSHARRPRARARGGLRRPRRPSGRGERAVRRPAVARSHGDAVTRDREHTTHTERKGAS